MSDSPQKKYLSPILGAVLLIVILLVSGTYTNEDGGCSPNPRGTGGPATATSAQVAPAAAPAPNPPPATRDVRLGNPTPIEPAAEAAGPDAHPPAPAMTGEDHPE